MNDPPPVSDAPPPGRTDGGALSPLSGSYLLIVVGEPQTEQHKETILSKITKGLRSWDEKKAHVDIHKELLTIAQLNLEGEEQKGGERLIQYATENLVAEVLIHPQVNTLQQCLKNLLSSFTKHRHIIHSGYAFAGNGSWMLQDGTFSVSDLLAAFSEYEVQRVLHAYERCITIDIHCAPEGDWSTDAMMREPFSKLCEVTINPEDKIETTAGISSFIEYLSRFVSIQPVEQVLKPSDIVGNIRFSRPTLYVFPGGQGDSALFGVNGFNMLVDGGYNRKACFWDFTRHLDRLDAVLVTRLNTSNVMGITSVVRKKATNSVYPQIGHFFCNVAGTQKSPDGDKDKDTLLVNIWDEGHLLRENLRHIGLKPHLCFRDNSLEPINLYHKVGHGKLDMYVINPSRDSKEVREFMQTWNNEVIGSELGFVTYKIGNRSFPCPITNMNSVCALVIWQPNDPNDTITRILFPGSTPQQKVLEGLEKFKHLEFLKHPTCSAKSIKSSYEERKSKAIEKIATDGSPRKYYSTSSPIYKLRKERSERSLSREERRKKKTEVIEKSSHEIREKKIERRIVRREDKKHEPKPTSDLKETKDKINGEIGTKSEKDTTKISGFSDELKPFEKETSAFEKPVDSILVNGSLPESGKPSEDFGKSLLDETKESSLVSVESGVIMTDDRESSLEIEQARDKLPEIPPTETLPEEALPPKPLKDDSKPIIDKPKRYRKPKVESRIDTGSSRADRKRLKEKRMMEKKEKLESQEKIRDESIESTAEKQEKEEEKKSMKIKRPQTLKPEDSPRKINTEHMQVTDTTEIKKKPKRDLPEDKAAKQSVGKVSKTERKTTKLKSRTTEDRTRVLKSAEVKSSPKQPIRTTPGKQIKLSKPKKSENVESPKEMPIKKIISGAAVKAGVVAAAAAGLSVVEAASDKEDIEDIIKPLPDEEEIILKTKEELAADQDEEDRISDIINIPGVQEIKIEDEAFQILEKQKIEEEEKDSLILHEEGVFERPEKEEVKEIDEHEIIEEEEEPIEPEKQIILEHKTISKQLETLQEEQIEADKTTTTLPIKKELVELIEEDEEGEEDEKRSIPEKEDEAEKDIKAREKIKEMEKKQLSEEFAKDEKLSHEDDLKKTDEKDDERKVKDEDRDIEEEDYDEEKEDIYATLPSSAKLTEYKEKYEEKPIRSLFSGFSVPPDEVAQVLEKEKKEPLIGPEPVHGEEPTQKEYNIEKKVEPVQPQLPPRDVIKTPDEVDDLPIHEEVDSTEHDIYEEISYTDLKMNIVSLPSQEISKEVSDVDKFADKDSKLDKDKDAAGDISKDDNEKKLALEGLEKEGLEKMEKELQKDIEDNDKVVLVSKSEDKLQESVDIQETAIQKTKIMSEEVVSVSPSEKEPEAEDLKAESLVKKIMTNISSHVKEEIEKEQGEKDVVEKETSYEKDIEEKLPKQGKICKQDGAIIDQVPLSMPTLEENKHLDSIPSKDAQILEDKNVMKHELENITIDAIKSEEQLYEESHVKDSSTDDVQVKDLLISKETPIVKQTIVKEQISATHVEETLYEQEISKSSPIDQKAHDKSDDIDYVVSKIDSLQDDSKKDSAKHHIDDQTVLKDAEFEQSSKIEKVTPIDEQLSFIDKPKEQAPGGFRKESTEKEAVFLESTSPKDELSSEKQTEEALELSSSEKEYSMQSKTAELDVDSLKTEQKPSGEVIPSKKMLDEEQVSKPLEKDKVIDTIAPDTDVETILKISESLEHIHQEKSPEIVEEIIKDVVTDKESSKDDRREYEAVETKKTIEDEISTDEQIFLIEKPCTIEKISQKDQDKEIKQTHEDKSVDAAESTEIDNSIEKVSEKSLETELNVHLDKSTDHIKEESPTQSIKEDKVEEQIEKDRDIEEIVLKSIKIEEVKETQIPNIEFEEKLVLTPESEIVSKSSQDKAAEKTPEIDNVSLPSLEKTPENEKVTPKPSEKFDESEKFSPSALEKIPKTEEITPEITPIPLKVEKVETIPFETKKVSPTPLEKGDEAEKVSPSNLEKASEIEEVSPTHLKETPVEKDITTLVEKTVEIEKDTSAHLEEIAEVTSDSEKATQAHREKSPETEKIRQLSDENIVGIEKICLTTLEKSPEIEIPKDSPIVQQTIESEKNSIGEKNSGY